MQLKTQAADDFQAVQKCTFNFNFILHTVIDINILIMSQYCSTSMFWHASDT